MTTDSQTYELSLRRRENMLFFKRWLKHPFQMGTLAPITPSLARLAAESVKDTSQLIVEIGAGTGRLTRALLERGVKSENLVLVELDPDLCGFLRETLPGLSYCKEAVPQVIHGDAAELASIIPPSFVGNVGMVVSAIPFMYIPPAVREAIVKSVFKVMKPGGRMVHVTYNPKSPLAFMPQLKQERIGSLWYNLPPGFVWQYQNVDN